MNTHNTGEHNSYVCRPSLCFEIKWNSPTNKENRNRDLRNLWKTTTQTVLTSRCFRTTLYCTLIRTSCVPLKSWVLPPGICIFDGGSSGKKLPLMFPPRLSRWGSGLQLPPRPPPPARVQLLLSSTNTRVTLDWYTYSFLIHSLHIRYLTYHFFLLLVCKVSFQNWIREKGSCLVRIWECFRPSPIWSMRS